MANELVEIGDHSPAHIMSIALANGQDLDKLEKLLELQIRYEENEAKKAYHKAMAAFKANPPDIEKDKFVSFATSKGQTSYKHATLANVTSKINKALSQFGLSASWKTRQENGSVHVTCTITHEMGHSESTTLESPPDQSGGKNSIQAIGSTLSYLERYSLLALTGLATSDMDDDGEATEVVEYVTGEDLAHLKKLHKEVVTKPAIFLKAAKIESLDKIPVDRFNAILNLLNERKVALATKGNGNGDN